MSDEKNIITDDENFYWDTLNLADDLYDQGKLEEAEELYKKIAGDKDETGDANAHYGYLLDELGRYDEAHDYFARVLHGYADTSPREGVVYHINTSSHYMDLRYDTNTDKLIQVCLEVEEPTKQASDIENILLKSYNTDDPDGKWEPRRQLIRLYGTGKYVFNNGEAISVAGFPNHEKLQAFVADTVEDDCDVVDIISAICYDKDNIDEASAEVLELAWKAVKADEAVHHANISLFRLYF